MNSQEELNERFMAYVAERHPDWSGGLVTPDANPLPVDFVELVLANPRGPEWPSLAVRTEDRRLTVYFINHAHFQGDDHDALLTACCDLVADILAERTVSVMVYHAGRPYVSDFCRVEEVPLVEEASRPLPPPRKPGFFSRLLGRVPDEGAQTVTTWRSYGPVHYSLEPLPSRPRHLEVRSWLGNCDRRTLLG